MPGPGRGADVGGRPDVRRGARADRRAGRRGRPATRWPSDDLVAGLLMIHDLTRCRSRSGSAQALDTVRPYMESHGGNVELLGIEDGVARLRLEGSCKSCRASSSTLELAVRQALEAAAPDLEGMDVEGIGEEPERPTVTGMPLPIVQVNGTRRGTRSSDRRVGRACVAHRRGRRAARGGQRRRHAARLPQPLRRAAAARSTAARSASGALGCPACGRTTSCRRPAGRWTTTTSSSSRCRCCASRRRSGWRCEHAPSGSTWIGGRRAVAAR